MTVDRQIRLRGCEGGDCGGKCLWKKARKPLKQGNTAESRIGGGALNIASLPTLPASAIERLAHQTPVTELQSRTPARGALCVPDAPNNRGPQAREPSKCVNRRSNGERLAKEAF